MEYLYLQIEQLNLYLASQNWTPCRSCTPVLRTQTLSWELLLSGERSLHSTAKSCTIRWQWVITNQNVRNFREAKSFFGFLENVCSKFNFPMSPHVRPLVVWLVSWSVWWLVGWKDLRGQVTFLKVCLLEVWMTLIIPRSTLFWITTVFRPKNERLGVFNISRADMSRLCSCQLPDVSRKYWRENRNIDAFSVWKQC